MIGEIKVKRTTSRRLIWGVAGVAAIVVVVWMVFGGTGGAEVEVVRTRRGPIREVVEERGMTRLPETHEITMPISGRVERIALREGTPVEKGQVVAKLVDLDIQLPVQQAQAAVDRLEAAIKRNADTTVETTALAQAQKFVESMQATVDAAKARVEAGEAQFNYAEANFGRVQKLYQSNVQTQDDLDRAYLQKVQAAVSYRQDRLVYASLVALQAATDLMPQLIRQYIDRKLLTQAELEKQRAEATVQLLAARENQRRAVMTSPVDGVVLKRYVDDEQFLAAGTPLLEIGNLDELEIEADILSLEVTRIQPGDPVEIFLGSTYRRPAARGKVERIYPAAFTKISSLGVEEQRVKVIVSLEPEEIRRLRAEYQLGVGFRVRVRIVTDEKQDAIVLPRSSVIRNAAGDAYVFAVENGRLVRRPVELGLRNDELVEIVEGVGAGDLVLRSPDLTAEAGTKVRAVELEY
ncbi:efflux RND transporter periplasmic adaptor subunit [Thermostilla marina]